MEIDIMTNFEKYKDELLKLAVINIGAVDKVTNEPSICCETACSNCLFDNGQDYCKNMLKNWLDTEYKEPEIDWSKVPVDTKVYVRNNEEAEWTSRYFARVSSTGIPLVWNYGVTSFTSVSDNSVSSWNYIKLAEEDKCNEDI